MSVLIKGLDAPNHPQKITIEFINEGQVITSVGNFEYCEVPTPHGRLIDADELQKKFDLAQKSLDQHGQEFSNAFMSTSQEISTEWWAVEQKLDDAETVIESEE